MAQNVGQVALDIVVGKNEVTGANGVLSKMGGIAKTAGAAMAAGMAVASGALIAVGQSAIGAYGSYEQLTGGVETLFKDMSDEVIENASNAYKTAGMSANEYMSTVTSFSASLLQSVGGDTVKAAAAADVAIRDMSDNANKMGTSMEMIQNAYQGFAKQNYTMLDNLKLGYGGTKTEMQRLLADAEKLTGKKFDISNFNDITEAIHAIQTEMGITGTTALEASGTIQGSAGSMKAAWQNLLVGLADPTQNFSRLVTNFVDSVAAAASNLVPRLTNVLTGVVNLVTQLAPVIVAELPKMVQAILPPLLEGAISLVTAVIEALPSMIQMIVEMLPTLIPMLITGLIAMIVMLCENMAQIIQPIIDNLPLIIVSIVDALMQNLPALIQGAVALVVGVVNALPYIILALLDALPDIIVSVTNGLLAALPTLIAGVGQIITSVVSAVWEFLTGFPESVGNYVKTIWGNIGNVISGAWEAIKTAIATYINTIKTNIETIWNGIKNTISNVINTIKTTISNGFNAAKSTVTDIFDGIKSKISGVMDGAKNIVSGAIDKIKSFFKFEWSLPKIKLPHFSIQGEFSLNPPSIPHLSVDWYSKAMNNGMILDTATIFGMSKNGTLLGGGEAGSETIVGTRSLLSMIQSAVSAGFGNRAAVQAPVLNNVRAGNGITENGGSKIDKLIELLEKLLAKDDSEMTVPIYIGNELIDEYILGRNNRATLRSGGRA